MRRKKLTALIVMFAFAFMFMPVVTKAQGQTAGSIDDCNILSTKSAGICHCGAIRGETEYIRTQGAICPKHGVNCSEYFAIYARTYYYCPNPACGDSWYGDWVFKTYDHD